MRPPGSKKGDYGRVLVVGGSERYVGAPALAGLGALAAGADIVVVAAPEKVAWAVNTFSPELITLKLKGKALSTTHVKALLKEDYDSMLVGNGAGTDRKTVSAVRELLKKGNNLTADADAFKARSVPKGSVLTPHIGEFELLFGKKPNTIAQRKREVKAMAKKHDCVILLKGPVDVVSDGKRIWTNATGNPYMTVGGTGDVLAGVVAALRARMPGYEAAVMAAKINGMAGDIALRKYGRCFGSLLIREIPKLLQQ